MTVRTARLTALIVALAAALFIVDFAMPLGIAAAVPYVAVVLVAERFRSVRCIYVVAGLCSALTLAGYFLSAGAGTPWMVLANRILALFAIWLTAILLGATVTAGYERAARDKRSRHLLGSSPAVIYTCRADGTRGATYMSDNVRARMGYEASAFVDNPDFWADNLHPDDRSAALAEVERIKECDHHVFEYRFRHSDGRYRWLRDEMRLMRDADDRPTEIIGSWVDITDRRKAEERVNAAGARLAGILHVAPNAIISTDGECRIEVFSRGAEVLFGYSADEVLGRHIEMLIPERFRERHERQIADFLNSNAESRAMSRRGEILGRREDASEFPALASIARHIDDNGVTLTVILHDISEMKKTQGDLLAAKEQAEYASRAKSEFLASMSHELRTPLNAIIGFSEIMAGETFGPLGDKRYGEYARDIRAAGEHLLDLIGDILDVAKIEAGKASLHDEATDIDTLIRACLALVRERALGAGVAIGCDQPDCGIPDCGIMVWADPRMLKQVLVNLLSNAIKFTPEGGKVTVAAGCGADGSFGLEVLDTGIGIKAEDLPRALSKFEQIESAFTRSQPGTGLGLPLCQSMIDLHDGSLEIESEPGVGTKVVVRLPPGRVLAASREASLAAATAPSARPRRGAA